MITSNQIVAVPRLTWMAFAVAPLLTPAISLVSLSVGADRIPSVDFLWFLIVAVAVAYAIALLLGLPIYLYFQKRRIYSAYAYAFGGAGIVSFALPICVWLGRMAVPEDPILVASFALLFLMFGVASALLFYAIAQPGG